MVAAAPGIAAVSGVIAPAAAILSPALVGGAMVVPLIPAVASATPLAATLPPGNPYFLPLGNPSLPVAATLAPSFLPAGNTSLPTAATLAPSFLPAGNTSLAVAATLPPGTPSLPAAATLAPSFLPAGNTSLPAAGKERVSCATKRMNNSLKYICLDIECRCLGEGRRRLCWVFMRPQFRFRHRLRRAGIDWHKGVTSLEPASNSLLERKSPLHY